VGAAREAVSRARERRSGRTRTTGRTDPHGGFSIRRRIRRNRYVLDTRNRTVGGDVVVPLRAALSVPALGTRLSSLHRGDATHPVGVPAPGEVAGDAPLVHVVRLGRGNENVDDPPAAAQAGGGAGRSQRFRRPGSLEAERLTRSRQMPRREVSGGAAVVMRRPSHPHSVDAPLQFSALAGSCASSTRLRSAEVPPLYA